MLILLTLLVRANGRMLQSLVKWLEHIQYQQAKQLHITRQLVDALPLPAFVRTSALAVGRPLTAVFNLDSTSQALPCSKTLHALHATTKRLHAINAQHGNAMGDLLLKEVGLRMMDIANDQANIARLGGDEPELVRQQCRAVEKGATRTPVPFTLQLCVS